MKIPYRRIANVLVVIAVTAASATIVSRVPPFLAFAVAAAASLCWCRWVEVER